ncbi:hypothetical protein T492DRAFT_945621 [Pavlovales sp. CCMP2436]|nr:hypothetical protein T492DRAFT_945621 [Pavlovales sp. CCMP2436]
MLRESSRPGLSRTAPPTLERVRRAQSPLRSGAQPATFSPEGGQFKSRSLHLGSVPAASPANFTGRQSSGRQSSSSYGNGFSAHRSPPMPPRGPMVPVLDLNDITKQVNAELGSGLLVTPRGKTVVKRNTVIAHKTYFEQFVPRWFPGRGTPLPAPRIPREEDSFSPSSLHESSVSMPTSERASRNGPLHAPRGSANGAPAGAREGDDDAVGERGLDA